MDGTTLAESPRKMPGNHEDKLQNITEVCNVSREEAIRVLEVCRMDEAMAIERFLSGKGVSVWSEVSKKKKTLSRPLPRPFPTSTVESSQDPHPHFGSNPSRSGHRRTPRPSIQRSKGVSMISFPKRSPVDSATENNPSGLQLERPRKASTKEPEHQQQARRRNSASPQKSHLSHRDMWPETNRNICNFSVHPAENWDEQSPIPRQMDVWYSGVTNPDAIKSMDADGDQVSPLGTGRDTSGRTSIPHDQREKPRATRRRFNYAAAVAAGTSHAKQLQEMASDVERTGLLDGRSAKEDGLMTASAVDEPQIPSLSNTVAEELRATDEVDNDISRISPDACNTHPQTHDSSTAESSSLHGIDQISNTSATKKERKQDASSMGQGSWTARSGETLGNVTRSELAQKSQLGSINSPSRRNVDEGVGESLSLQFGSLGLNGLEGVNWSASNKSSEKESTVAEGDDSDLIRDSSINSTLNRNSSINSIHGIVSATPVTAPVSAAALSRSAHPAVHNSGEVTGDRLSDISASKSMPARSGSKSTSSGVFPVLPVGPAGSYPPPNYAAPYLIPQVHGYSPGIGSFESSGDIGSSRPVGTGPPASLSLYDPTSLPALASRNGKFAGIPGLGDLPGTPPIPGAMRKDAIREVADIDEASGLSSSGLQAGIDPLGGPYMLPGYPSIQYPMYAFPNAPYPAPPGMTTAGPNPFPYPHAGHVAPAQNSRGGFGFEDGSVALGRVRSSSGMGESVYTPGAYLPSSHSNDQKPANDVSYKQIRTTPQTGNGLGQLNVSGGVVHGMTYSEYSPTASGAGSNSFVGSSGIHMGWNSREGGSVRAETLPGSRAVSHAGSQTSTLYPSAPGGAPTGYWALQGGYFP